MIFESSSSEGDVDDDMPGLCCMDDPASGRETESSESDTSKQCLFGAQAFLNSLNSWSRILKPVQRV